MIRIVLVDDQDVVRAGLRTLLEVEPDLQVVGEATDGYAAIEITRSLDPDVVIMDVRMPRLDGIAATSSIVGAGLRAKVCVLTTYALDEYLFDALTAGASGFLLKTDTSDRIIATIRAVAAGEFALGPRTTARLVDRYTRGPRPPSKAADLLAVLTAREREVFALLAEGLSNAEIAERLVVGEGTVKTHVAHILLKLGLRDRVQAVVMAHRNGLV
mgnify:CR=1 FL=1